MVTRDSRKSARGSPAYQKLVPLLIELRESAGLTQRDLAHSLLRPQSWVSKVELGERRLDAAELIEWCQAAGADPVQFFKQMVKELA